MGCKKIEERLTSVFQWYGELVGRHPLPFLLVPLLVTLVSGPGLLIMKYDDDAVLLFTPYTAPSRREQQIGRQFAHTAAPDRNSTSSKKLTLPVSSDDPYTDLWFNLQVTADENLVNQHSWTVISRFVNDIYENFTCRVDDWVESEDAVIKRKVSSSKAPYILRYKDFCNPKRGCLQLNTMVERVRDLLNNTKYGNNSKVLLTYPVMYVWDRPFNWGQYIYGVEVNPESGKLESARVLGLYLQFQVKDDVRAQNAAKSCVRQLTQFTISRNRDNVEVRQSNLTFHPLSEALLADEVSRVQDYSIPYLVGTIVLIIIFISVTSFRRRFPALTIVGACMGVLTVGLSLLASFGFLCMCGVHMNFVVSITPFLVLCVGIDNDFLVTSAWRQTADGESSVQRRMGKAFADCGPSLTITSVNDILCFGVGYLSETPAVADFCLHTCTALLFRFLFQLTFFAAVTVYMGRRETRIEGPVSEKPKARFSLFKTPSIAAADSLPKKSLPPTILGFAGLKAAGDVASTRKKAHQRIHTFFAKTYAPFLMRKSVRLVTAIVYCAYIVSSVYGAATWTINITMEKLFFDDSILQESLGNAGKFVMPEVIIGKVFVTAPPDFRHKAETDRFLQFVRDLENLDDEKLSQDYNTPVSDRTDVWIRPYTEFLANIHPSDDDGEFQADFYDYLPDFLDSSDYSRFLNDLRFKRDGLNESSTPKLDKFQFVVSYFRSQHPFSYQDNIDFLLRWRAVCRNYSEYEAVVFDYFQMSSYYDQRLTLAPTCLQTMGIALLSMSVVTALLMPHIRSMFFICLSFLSVDVGVIAGLNMWSSPLDPTTMAFVLMTIGFSVYYTARVCYCYQSASHSLSSREKMRPTMGTVGWPILQGALATLVGIIPIVFIPCYMMRVFYRTVVLVVVIGLAHGLLIMPVLMSSFDRPSSPLAARRQHAAECARRKTCGKGHPPDTLSECSSQ